MKDMSAGRPPHFDTPDKLQELVDDYFYQLEQIKESPTITGLAFHLGFASRNSLYDYEGRDEFSGIIKKARLRVEMGYEKKLHGKYPPIGAIFALKNMGWSDKQEIKHEGIPDPTISVSIAKPSDE